VKFRPRCRYPPVTGSRQLKRSGHEKKLGNLYGAGNARLAAENETSQHPKRRKPRREEGRDESRYLIAAKQDGKTLFHWADLVKLGLSGGEGGGNPVELGKNKLILFS